MSGDADSRKVGHPALTPILRNIRFLATETNDCSWPGDVVQLVIAADFFCSKPVHLTVAMGANNDLFGDLRKIATLVMH